MDGTVASAAMWMLSYNLQSTGTNKTPITALNTEAGAWGMGVGVGLGAALHGSSPSS
jgi:hypothetical protein